MLFTQYSIEYMSYIGKEVHQCLKIVFTIYVCTNTNNRIAKLKIISFHVRNSQSNTMCTIWVP